MCLWLMQAYIVRLNGTEGKVFGRYGHFAQGIEQSALANIGQSNNAHLHHTNTLVLLMTSCGPQMNGRGEG